MKNILDLLNSTPLYLICGAIILFVMAFSILFMIRAYRAGIAMGMDKTKLKRTITSSVTFSVLPSISILLGVIALSGTLGIPLPWLRLSVVGALHYETSVADVAARSIGLSGLNAAEMTASAYTLSDLDYAVAVKTGTPQVTTDTTNSAAIAFAPADENVQPEVAIGIMLEEGYGASRLIREILLAWEETVR